MCMLLPVRLSVRVCVTDMGVGITKHAGHVHKACVFKLSQKWPEFLRL